MGPAALGRRFCFWGAGGDLATGGLGDLGGRGRQGWGGGGGDFGRDFGLILGLCWGGEGSMVGS